MKKLILISFGVLFLQLLSIESVFSHDFVPVFNVSSHLSFSGKTILTETTVAGVYDQLEADKKVFLENMQLYFEANFHISHKGKICIFKSIDAITQSLPSGEEVSPPGEGITIFKGVFICETKLEKKEDLTIESTLFDMFKSPNWYHFITLQDGDEKSEIILKYENRIYKGQNVPPGDIQSIKSLSKESKSEVSSSLPSKNGGSFFGVMLDFLGIGIQHILFGTDHILFVILCVMMIVSLKEVLYMTSVFTIAHSITLILAGLGIIQITGKIVEPLIALSIVFLAVQNFYILGKKQKQNYNVQNRLFLVFGFGLFHGLGFAGSLEDIIIPERYFLSSLLSFNVGVEIGQLFIILIAFPTFFMLRKYIPKWEKLSLQTIASIIFIIASYWTLERIFFS